MLQRLQTRYFEGISKKNILRFFSFFFSSTFKKIVDAYARTIINLIKKKKYSSDLLLNKIR